MPGALAQGQNPVPSVAILQGLWTGHQRAVRETLSGESPAIGRVDVLTSWQKAVGRYFAGLWNLLLRSRQARPVAVCQEARRTIHPGRERPHQALAYRTPGQVFEDEPPTRRISQRSAGLSSGLVIHHPAGDSLNLASLLS